MGGKPCVRGTRVTVGMIVESIGAGLTVGDLLADFPYLEEADLRDALCFAAEIAQGDFDLNGRNLQLHATL
jgi:uncharacterized protein (DUF433 family)